MARGQPGVLCLVLWLVAFNAAAAQTVPPSVEAGRVPQRYREAPTPKSLPRTDGIVLPSTVPPENASSLSLNISRFEITGSTVFSNDDCADLTEPLLHRSISLSEVYALAAKITARYGQAGYVLSRAVVPPQELSRHGAIVHLRIVEGYVDEVIWPDGIKVRYRDFFSDYAARIVASRPVNIKVIERELLLASDLPGLNFSSMFKPSATTANASTLIVTMHEKPISVEASIDNRGSKGRGPWQAQAAGTASNWLGLHEAITAKYATAVPSMDQLQFVQGTWHQVLTSDGLSFTFDGSYNTGIPGLGALQAINYDSKGLLFNAALAYPVIRSRDENLALSGIAFVEGVSSTALNSPFTNDRIRGVRARMDYDNADTRGGINQLQITLSQGIDGLGSTSNANPIPSRAGGRVDFTKIEALASRTQQLSSVLPGLSLYGAIYGQYAGDPLLTSEQCSYGGKVFGRAFDPSALTGDNCVTSLLELRYDLVIPGNVFTRTQLYGFVDHGYLNRETTSVGTPTDQWGSSAGAGLRLGWRDNISGLVEAGRGIAGDIGQDWRTHAELTVRY